MNRLTRLRVDLLTSVRGWRAERRLRAETASDLMGIVVSLQKRIDDLEQDLDELRADSRRVAELRIQVEDRLLRND